MKLYNNNNNNKVRVLVSVYVSVPGARGGTGGAVHAALWQRPADICWMFLPCKALMRVGSLTWLVWPKPSLKKKIIKNQTVGNHTVLQLILKNNGKRNDFVKPPTKHTPVPLSCSPRRKHLQLKRVKVCARHQQPHPL